jgi:aspartate carbamoyltransferase catalytic subunit
MIGSKLRVTHLVSVDDFTKADLKELFILTDSIKKTPQKYKQALKNKILALLFYEPSTCRWIG